MLMSTRISILSAQSLVYETDFSVSPPNRCVFKASEVPLADRYGNNLHSKLCGVVPFICREYLKVMKRAGCLQNFIIEVPSGLCRYHIPRENKYPYWEVNHQTMSVAMQALAWSVHDHRDKFPK